MMDEPKQSNAGSRSSKGASGAGRAHRSNNGAHAPNHARQSCELGPSDDACNDEEWWRSDDSESSDGSEGGGVTRGRRRRMSEEDGSDVEGDRFLDPGADDLDEAWVLEQCGGRRSDAILSCPGCLTTLCVDCQQHAKFPNQWRAMFVMNCLVGSGKAASAAPADRRGAGEKRRLEEGPDSAPSSAGVGGADNSGAQAAQAEQPAPPAPGERPLLCEVCDTEVGAVDKEDICHFFNVFPSNA